jgi:hypothetical protein
VTDSVQIVVLPSTKFSGWPKSPHARPGVAIPLSEVFQRHYPYDAFALAHSIPTGVGAYRLTKEYLELGPLQMALLFVDLDAHKLLGKDLEGWQAEETCRARELFYEFPGLLYKTRGGLRLVWKIDLPWVEYEHIAKCWYHELETRGFRGVDHTAASFGRHMRLPFVRRDRVDERPMLEGSLEPLLWCPTSPAPAPRTRKPRPRSTKPSTDSLEPTDPLIALALARGLATPAGGGKWHVYCPTEKHNGGALTSATVVWDDGRFRCLKASCQKVQYSDWAATVTPPEVELEKVSEMVVNALKQGGIRYQLSALDITTGAGKSHVTRALLAPGAIHEGIKNALLTPTNALATQHRIASGAHQIAGVSAEIPDRAVCVQPKTVAALISAGVSSKYACQSCPQREGCKVADGVGDKKLGNISSHFMLHRYT